MELLGSRIFEAGVENQVVNRGQQRNDSMLFERASEEGEFLEISKPLQVLESKEGASKRS